MYGQVATCPKATLEIKKCSNLAYHLLKRSILFYDILLYSLDY